MNGVIDLDAPMQPDAMPGIGIGDLVRWIPIIQELVTAVAEAATTGATTIPLAKIRLHGAVYDLGPTPVKKEP